MSFSGWQAWQESIKTEQLLQTNEELRQTAEASLRRSFNFGGAYVGAILAPILSEPERAQAIEQYEQAQALVQREQAPQELEQSKLIYLQIRTDKQRNAALKIQEILKINHFIVPGIETLTIGPAATEVRYFRENEAEQAQKIADLLRQQKIPGVSVKYIAGFENSQCPNGPFRNLVCSRCVSIIITGFCSTRASVITWMTS